MPIARSRVLSALFLLSLAACSSSPSSTGGLDMAGLDQGAGGDNSTGTGGTTPSSTQGKGGSAQNQTQGGAGGTSPAQGAGGTSQTQGKGGSGNTTQGGGGTSQTQGKGGSGNSTQQGAGGAGNTTQQGAGGAGNTTQQGAGGAGNTTQQGAGGSNSFGGSGQGAGPGAGGSNSFGGSGQGAGPGAGGSGQGAGPGAGGSGATCQVFKPDNGCGSCADAQCCDVATTCAGDMACIACFTSMTPPASCGSDPNAQALAACLQQSCAMACGGGAGGAGPGAGGSGQGAGPGAGGSTTGGGIPTTCSEAMGQVGCCAPDGNVYYCSSTTSTKLHHGVCSAGNACGWTGQFYDCGGQGVDPSGQNPIDCGGTGAGAGPGAGGSSSFGGSGQGAGPGAGGSGQGAGPGAGGSGSTDPACANAGTATWSQVSAIFQSNCAVGGCHNSGQHGINPADYNSLIAGGTCGGLVAPGQPAMSDIINVVNGSGAGCTSMPPNSNGLSASDVKTITAWICAGATQN